jgi:hypothetical protein
LLASRAKPMVGVCEVAMPPTIVAIYTNPLEIMRTPQFLAVGILGSRQGINR